MGSKVSRSSGIAMTRSSRPSVLTVVEPPLVLPEVPPWLVVLVFAPIIGSLLYLFFSHPYLSRRRMLLHMDIRARSAKYYACKDDCADVLGDRLRSSKFIYEAAGAAPYKYSDVKYLPSGEAFFEQLKQELEKARKHIFMEYFIIDRGKMWYSVLDVLRRKVKEGVEVRVMYDDRD